MRFDKDIYYAILGGTVGLLLMVMIGWLLVDIFLMMDTVFRMIFIGSLMVPIVVTLILSNIQPLNRDSGFDIKHKVIQLQARIAEIEGTGIVVTKINGVRVRAIKTEYGPIMLEFSTGLQLSRKEVDTIEEVREIVEDYVIRIG